MPRRKNPEPTPHPLQQWRDEHLVTQTTLARKLGVHAVTISRWECGARKIDLRLLPQLAKLTGLNPSTLRPDLWELLGA